MKTFTSTQQLAYMSLSLAMHAIFLSLGLWLPGIFFILQLYLPIFTLISIYLLKSHYHVVYIVSTFILSFILFGDLGQLLFYVLPSVLLGYTLGILLKLNRNFLEIAYLSISVQGGILWLSLWLSNIFFNTNILRILYQLIGIQDHPYLFRLNPLLLFIFSILQVMMTFLVLFPFLKRLQINLQYVIPPTPLLYQFHITFIVIGIVGALVFPLLSMIVLPPIVFLSVYLYMYFFTRPTRYSTFFLLGALFVHPFVNAGLSVLLSQGYQVLSIYFLVLIPLFFHHKKSLRISPKNALI